MYKNMLPIGSVVRISGAVRLLMICGRIVGRGEDDTLYDYVGCIYPEGVVDSESMFFFNRDAIEQVLFIGFQNEEELQFKSEILDNLGELAIENGEVVPVGDWKLEEA